MSNHRTGLLAVLLSVFALWHAGPAAAQTYTYSLYLDSDLRADTGCSEGPAVGAETRLRVRVTGGPSPQIAEVTRSLCNGSTFPAGTVVGGGYPAGVDDGIGGSDTIELSDKLSALRVPTVNAIRLALVATSPSGEDTLVTTDGSPGGDPIYFGLPAIPIPLLGLPALFVLGALLVLVGGRRAARRRLRNLVAIVFLLSGVAGASRYAADGSVADWSGVTPLALDPAGDSSSGETAIDLRALFGVIEDDRAYFRIDVTNLQNTPPTAQPQTASTLEDQAVTLTLAGNDAEGDTLAFAISQAPTLGTLGPVVPATANTATVVYTPNPDVNGSDSFRFTVSDGQAVSAAATVGLTIEPVNDAPSFTKGADQTVLEDSGARTVTGWATDMAAGPANEAGQALDFQVDTDNPTLFSAAPAITPDGTLSFTPAPDANGTATVTVRLHDDGGTDNGGVDTSAPQTFTITVTAVNDAPSFTKGPDQTALEDSGAQTVTGWATGISPGPADEAGQVVDFQVSTSNPTLFGTAPAITPDGTLSFTPAADASGTATVTVRLHDDGGTANGGVDTSAPQTFTITITGVNDAPSFTKGPDQTVLEDSGAQTVTAWATAISAGPPNESGQALDFQVSTSNPALFGAAPAITPDGTLSFTPAPNANGTATVTVRLHDDGGTANGGVDTSAPQTFTITVTPVNDAPSFVKGADQTVLEDSGAQTVAGWATGISPGPADEAGQAVDFLVVSDNPTLFGTAPAIAPNGTLSFTPAPDANGTATVTVRLHDDGGTANGGIDTSAPQTFTITITGVNDAPSFTKGPDQSVLEDSGPRTVAGWATAISAGPPNESGQTLDFQISTTNPALFSAAPAITPDGTLSFTSAPNANGTASVTVRLHDDGGTDNGGVDTSAPQTFTINVTAVNDAPSFTAGANQTVLEDSGPHSVTGWATAISPGPPDEITQTVSFEVTGNTNPGLFSAGPAVAPNGTLSFTSAADASGTATITLVAKDNGGTANGGIDTSAPQTFTITVIDVNDAPSFTKGPDQSVLEDSGPRTVTGWATGISAGPPSESGQALDFQVSTSNPALFSAAPAITPDGTLSFTPAPNANGTVTVTVRLHDDGGTANGGVDTSAPQTFTINVTAVNDAPSFTKGADQTVLEDSGAHSVTGWATAISPGPPDESGQTVSFEVTGNTNPGLFSAGPAVAPNGTLSFTSAADASGTATITLVAKDNGGTANGGIDTSAPQTFTITVTDINDAPSFMKGPDQTVLEDSGPRTVTGWATGISAGPPSESGQVLDFQVSTSNPALFGAAPAITPGGTLSFTPAPNANGTATVTVRLHDDGGTANGGVDISAPQTFTITVTAVNDAPSFTKGADQTVLEDSGPRTVAGWATAISPGPADEAGQALDFQVGNDNAALFSAAPAITPSGTLSFTPAPNANGTATVTVRLHDDGGTANGGVDTSAPQTFTITVTAVNDAPSFTKGPDQSVPEDSGPQTVTAWATGISAGPPDEAGQALDFIVTHDNAALFSTAPAISPTGTLTYTSAPDAFGVATVTVRLHDNGGTANGGIDTSAPQTFTITITPVNDAPVIDLNGPAPGIDYAATYTEGDPAVLIVDAAALTVSDVDNTTLASARVAITNLLDGALETLSANAGATSIAIAYNSATGVLSLSGTDTLANYRDVLRTVRYRNASTAPDETTREIAFTVNDGDLDSAAAVSHVAVVGINTVPSFTAGPAITVDEDAGPQTIAAWATAIDDNDGGLQTLNFTVTQVSGTLTFTTAPAISPTGTLSFTTAPDANGTASFDVVLHDSGSDNNTSAAQTLTITATAVNDAPSFVKGPDVTVLEDSGAYSASGWATAISPGPADESSQVVTFQVGSSAPALFSAGPAIAQDGTLSFTPAPDAAGVATITVVAKDNGGTANGGVDTSVPQTFTITITDVNDAPSFVRGADQHVLDNAGAQTVTGWATAISPGPPSESGQTVLFQITGNSAPSAFSAGPAIASNGTLTYTPAIVPTGVTTATITVVAKDNGGTASGGIDTSAPQTFTIEVEHANVAPVLTNPTISYSTAGNTQLHVAGGTRPGLVAISDSGDLLGKAQPTDPDGPDAPSVVAASGSSANGGSYTVATNGAFSYVPPAGFSGTDTFTYQVTDGATPTPGLVTGTVSITVGQKVWYVRDLVDANNPSGGDGRSTDAFETLAAAQAASGDNDIIFVFRGNTGTTPLSGGITLKNGQKLWGEGIGLSLPGFGTLVPVGTKPVLTSAANTVSVVANTANGARTGVEVRGLQITGAAAISATSANAAALGVTVRDNDLRTTVAATTALAVTAGSTAAQTLAINNNMLQGTGAAINVTRTAGTLTVTDFANNQVRSAGPANPAIRFTGPGIVFDATPGGAYNAVSGGATVIGASGSPVSGGGMALTNVGGDLSFTDLDIYAGNGTALSVVGTGAVNAPAGTGMRVTVPAGVAMLSATAGPALDLQALTAALPFGEVTSTNSTATAFNVDGVDGTVSTGPGSAISGVTSAAAASLRVNNSSATVSYTGSINATTTGGGVLLTGNTGGFLYLTGPLILSTGTNTAFTATGGGTVTASNVDNVLTTTTATALNVANTAIGSGGLVFRSISANGAAKGIVLNTTGSTGGLSVTGIGGTAGSGGTIQNISVRGGEFTNTANLSLRNMSLINANTTVGGTCNDLTTTACNAAIYLSGVNGANFNNLNVSGTTVQQAINGNNVNGFTLVNSTLTNCGSSGSVETGCVKMRGLTGTASITGSNLAFPGADVVEIVNSSGSLTLNVDNSTFRDSQASSTGNTGLQVRSEGSANTVVNVTNSNFQRIRTVGLHATAIGNARNDVDVSTSTFDPGTGTMIGIDLDADDYGVLVFNVQNNPRVWSNGGPAINVFGDTNASISGRVLSNPDVRVLGASGSGIRSNINKNAVARLDVRNNTVNISGFDTGIDLSAIGRTATNPSGATNTLDATVRDNSITIGSVASYGIAIFSASNANDTNALCVSLLGNSVVRNPSSISSARMRVPSANGFFRMEGFTGGSAEATWNARGNSPTSTGGSEVSYGGAGTFGSCTAQLPTNPTLN